MTASTEDAPDFEVTLQWSEDRDALWGAVTRTVAEFQAGGAIQTRVSWWPGREVRVVGWRDGAFDGGKNPLQRERSDAGVGR